MADPKEITPEEKKEANSLLKRLQERMAIVTKVANGKKLTDKEEEIYKEIKK